MLSAFAATLALLGSVPAAQASAPATEYEFTVLGTLGGSRSEARAMNSKGVVVGFSHIKGDGAYHAFRWDPRRGMRDLGTLKGTKDSRAVDINNCGQVIGVSYDTRGRQFGWVWDPKTGKLTSLGENASPTAINDSGQIIGDIRDSEQDALRAVVWSAGTLKMTQIGLNHKSSAYPLSQNRRGQVLGQSLEGETWTTFVWHPQTRKARRLPIEASEINDKGVALGVTALFDTRTGRTKMLPPVQDGEAVGRALNNSGLVAGNVSRAGPASAFAWRPWRKNVKLIATQCTHSTTSSINESGVIVGQCTPSGSDFIQNQVFVWAPKAGTQYLTASVPGKLGVAGDPLISDSGRIAANLFGTGGEDPEDTGVAVVWSPRKG